MLRQERPDAVVICTPTFLHPAIATECVDRGINFFVEKPLGRTALESAKIVDGCKAKGLITQVGYACMSFTPTFAKAREILNSGALGRVRFAEGRMFSNQTMARAKNWQYDPNLSGG